MGIDQAEAIIDVSPPQLKHTALPPPPHNGVGREEDSLLNVLMVQPKPPKQDLVRLMTLSGEILRFECKMVNGQPEDEILRFECKMVNGQPEDEILRFECKMVNGQ